MRRKLFYLAPLGIVGLTLLIAFGGYIVQQLWNFVLPPLFGWHAIGFWQALAMLALCRILFGGSGGMGMRSGIRRGMSDRMNSMTPEERDRYWRGIRARCGFPAPPSGESNVL